MALFTVRFRSQNGKKLVIPAPELIPLSWLDRLLTVYFSFVLGLELWRLDPEGPDIVGLELS